MKKAIMHQCQNLVEKAASGKTTDLGLPQEGWVSILRKALGMSGAQLARRLGVSRAQVAQSERNEANGAITLKTLHKMADALDGRLVYMIVPNQNVKEAIKQRARQKACQLVQLADIQMALEAQTISKASREFEIDRLTEEFLATIPSDLWDDVEA